MGNRIVDSVGPDQRGDASPMVSFIIYFGSALGSALYSAMFSVGSGASGAMIGELSPDVFMDGLWLAAIVGVALSLLTLFLAWVFPEERPPA